MTMPMPPEVEDLLDNCLCDFEHLEIILFLRSNSARRWTAADLMSAIPMSEELLAKALSELCSDGLATATVDPPVRYRYDPKTGELESSMTDLAAIYRDNRVAVISRLSMNAINRIKLRTARAFADAFVVSRDRKGGRDG